MESITKELRDMILGASESVMTPYEMQEEIYRMNFEIMLLSQNQSHLLTRIKELEKANGITPDISIIDDIINNTMH